MSDEIAAARPSGRCPVCGKPAQAKWQPFCSKRCADVDLNRWLSGGYRIETDEVPPDGEPPPPAKPDQDR
jgi:endogenous inhibitor of DNA gyrase (YacG/DUF329 family)